MAHNKRVQVLYGNRGWSVKSARITLQKPAKATPHMDAAERWLLLHDKPKKGWVRFEKKRIQHYFTTNKSSFKTACGQVVQFQKNLTTNGSSMSGLSCCKKCQKALAKQRLKAQYRASNGAGLDHDGPQNHPRRGGCPEHGNKLPAKTL